MRHVTFYHLETGLLNGTSLMVSDDAAVAMNTPAGHAPMDHPPGAQLDHRNQRVDLQKLAAEDDAAATAWAAKKDANRLARTAGGDPGEDPPAPARGTATAAHIVDYQPPAPSADHEWNAQTRFWQLNRAALQRGADQRAAAVLEASQHGLVRRLALNPGDAAARAKLEALDDQIARLTSNQGG